MCSLSLSDWSQLAYNCGKVCNRERSQLFRVGRCSLSYGPAARHVPGHKGSCTADRDSVSIFHRNLAGRFDRSARPGGRERDRGASQDSLSCGCGCVERVKEGLTRVVVAGRRCGMDIDSLAIGGETR